MSQTTLKYGLHTNSNTCLWQNKHICCINIFGNICCTNCSSSLKSTYDNEYYICILSMYFTCILCCVSCICTCLGSAQIYWWLTSDPELLVLLMWVKRVTVCVRGLCPVYSCCVSCVTYTMHVNERLCVFTVLLFTSWPRQHLSVVPWKDAAVDSATRMPMCFNEERASVWFVGLSDTSLDTDQGQSWHP